MHTTLVIINLLFYIIIGGTLEKYLKAIPFLLCFIGCTLFYPMVSITYCQIVGIDPTLPNTSINLTDGFCLLSGGVFGILVMTSLIFPDKKLFNLVEYKYLVPIILFTNPLMSIFDKNWDITIISQILTIIIGSFYYFIFTTFISPFKELEENDKDI